MLRNLEETNISNIQTKRMEITLNKTTIPSKIELYSIPKKNLFFFVLFYNPKKMVPITTILNIFTFTLIFLLNPLDSYIQTIYYPTQDSVSISGSPFHYPGVFLP